MERLEQVRLPDAVRPDREHEPGTQTELQLRVGAEIDERDAIDDQLGLTFANRAGESA
jgi:hypothetical protein